MLLFKLYLTIVMRYAYNKTNTYYKYLYATNDITYYYQSSGLCKNPRRLRIVIKLCKHIMNYNPPTITLKNAQYI